jgi:hypothetical protein
VSNDAFGSLRVGPPIEGYNVKTIMVARVVLEFVLFGWFVPGRRWRDT